MNAAAGVLGVAAAVQVLLMVREGHWHRHGINATIALFVLISLAPYAAAAWRMRARASASPRKDLVLALLLAAAGPGIAAWGIFVTGGDQRGLVFLFLPPLQALVLLVSLAF